ncbi:hypothetical protein [Teredinibacter franksiae]|uniref:hypothetical protein n=1 Tax=Teredinibacter franksiae TaxID=2761453 RepID=UPI001626493F|nr:hypothetical protein [Teredinibacter franksiae]
MINYIKDNALPQSILLFLTILSSSVVSAYEAKGYIEIPYNGTIQQYCETNPDFNLITESAFNARSEIRSQVNSRLQEKLLDALPGYVSLTKLDVQLDGEITIELDGLNNGSVAVRTGGMGVDISIHVKMENTLGLVSGEVHANTTPIWMTGDYDIFSGRIENLEMSSPPQVSISAELNGIFNFIPIIKNYMEGYAEDEMREGVVSGMESINDQLGSTDIMLFGLNQKLPDDLYVYNNIDYGVKIKDELANITNGEKIRFSIVNNTVSLNITDDFKIKFVHDTVRPYCDPHRSCSVNGPYGSIWLPGGYDHDLDGFCSGAPSNPEPTPEPTPKPTPTNCYVQGPYGPINICK